MNKQYEVFICYRRRDTATLAVAIHRFLNSNGIQTFCDLVDDPNYVLEKGIYDLIRRTPIFIFLASAGALKDSRSYKSWVRQELDCAIASDRKVICVRVDAFEDKALDQLPECLSKLFEAPKVVLHTRTPSAQALRLILDAVRFLPCRKSEDNIDELMLIDDTIAELITGVCNTVRLTQQPIQDFLNQILPHRHGRSTSPITANALIAATTSLEKELERSIVRRAVVVSMLRSLSRSQSPSSYDINAIWPLLYSTLNLESGLPIYATKSAQGFIVIPLYSLLQDGQIRELLRLHIWVPDGNHTGRASLDNLDSLDLFMVHSHQPHAQSWLLAGELRNTVYKVGKILDGDSRKTGYALFFVRWDGHKHYNIHHAVSRAINSGACVQVERECSVNLEAGQSYIIPAGEFHDTISLFNDRAPSFVATLFFFDASRGWVDDAAVVGPSRVNYFECSRLPETNVHSLIDNLDQSIKNGS